MIPELPIFVVTAIAVGICVWLMLHHNRRHGQFDEPPNLDTRGPDDRR